jgi:hypothetical protein
LPVSPPFSAGDLIVKIKASAQVVHHVELFGKIITWGLLSIQERNVKVFLETVEKPASERLMENVHMQGFRNPEE